MIKLSTIYSKKAQYRSVTKDSNVGKIILINWHKIMGAFVDEFRFEGIYKQKLYVVTENITWNSEIRFYKNAARKDQ